MNICTGLPTDSESDTVFGKSPKNVHAMNPTASNDEFVLSVSESNA